ncbi:MAG: Gfo/Idh/MocA family oxidoreductase [Acidobacteria bacterium]|nr:Gfo/Idh/MocA family oxidoreductase [Acidobacteriota bacterium]
MQRRHFFLGALGSTALVRPAFSQSSSSPLGVGVIGVGNRGSYDMQAAMAQPEVKITALCDIKPDRLDKAASGAAAHKPATFKDYRELLQRKDVDAVVIATPCDLHVEMSLAALKAGKHVYCEKPAGVEPASIQRLVNAVRASDRVYLIGQQTRSVTRVRRTIAKIREGVIGEVIMVKAQRHASADLPHDSSSNDWFFVARRSGDVIVEMSVHNLDVCNWVIDSRPDRAAGFGGALLWKNDPPGRTNMDGYTLSYEYANGVKLSYTQVFFHPNGMPGNGQTNYVYGTKGGVNLDTSTAYSFERGVKPVVLAEPEKDPPHAHMAAFLECIRTGKKPFADITVAATAALTAIMGRDSIYRKQVVTWDSMGVKI